MSRNITVHYNDKDREPEDHVFPENLYELPWNEYQEIERKVKMNAELDRDGNIKSFDTSKTDMVEIQNVMAQKILDYNNISINNVQTQTVKQIISSYSGDMEEFGLKLKKNQEN